MEKNSLDDVIKLVLNSEDKESRAYGSCMLNMQNIMKQTAESQIEDNFKCYYCGRTAQDLLDENVFDPRLSDIDNESKTYCFLCQEHGMYDEVDHIKDPIKKEECLERFSLNRHRISVRGF